MSSMAQSRCLLTKRTDKARSSRSFFSAPKLISRMLMGFMLGSVESKEGARKSKRLSRQEQPAGEVAADADRVPFISVEGVVGAFPLEAAVGPGGHLELHDVIEPAEGPEDLQAGVAV